MVVIDVTANNCTPQTIVIGRRGTYDTMQIAFDLSYLVDAYGSGVAVLAVKRSQDESAYPAVVTQENNTLTWTVSETDTAYVGAGEAQLMWYVDGGLAKTIIYPMVVMRDILATSEDAPDEYQTWVDDLTALGAETLQNAQDAAQSASDAEAAKDDAAAAKEAAEEAAETAQEAVVHAPIIQNGYWYIWNNGQYVDTGVRAEGQKGDKGDTGEKGDTGNGIASIAKTGTSGLVDTYTVTYTDGTTTTFTVTNGAKGDKGDTGATGNGIQSITKTGTSGNVDTYTITYTNGQTMTFTVTNGAVTSVAGKTGAVSLDANDVAFSESSTYGDGTVGAELSQQKNAIGEFKYSQTQKARIMTVTPSLSVGDTFYFKPLVWSGEEFNQISVQGILNGEYTTLARAFALNQKVYFTADKDYTSFLVAVNTQSVPVIDTTFEFILCNISKLDNLSGYVMNNWREGYQFRGYLPENANVNNVTLAGWYILTQPRISGTTGLPTDVSTDSILYVYPGNLTVQVLQELGSPHNYYQRYLYNNNTQQSLWIKRSFNSRVRNIYLFGDSLTKGVLGNGGTGKSYLEVAANIKGYTVVNCGVGGIGYVYSAQKLVSEVPWNTGEGRIRAQDVINHYAGELTNADTVVLAYGVNDWQTLGDPDVTIAESDRRATSTNITANVKTAIETIISAHAGVRILVVTPVNTSYRGGNVASEYALQTSLDNNGDGLEAMTLEKVFLAIVDACNYYGVEYIDMTHNNAAVNYLNINSVLPDKLHPSQTTYYRLAESLLNYAGSKADIAQLETALTQQKNAISQKAPVIINTASGDIVTFDDGADGMPIKHLIANIEAVQDLHGYDHPWPAGSGKNKAAEVAAITFAGITLTVKNNGEVVANGTATQDVVFNGEYFVAEAGNYYLNGCPDGGNLTNTYDVFMWDVTNSARPFRWNGTTAADSVFNSSEQAEVKIEAGHQYSIRIRIRSGYNANNVVFRPMLRLSTEADATFEPYSNICPITGRTGLSGKRTGKNLAYFANGMRSSAGVAFVFADGVITANGTASGNALSGNDNLYLPAGTYRVFNLAAQSDGAYIIVQNSEDSAAWPTLANTSGSLTDTFTLTRWTKLSVRARIPSGVTATNMVFKPMIVAGTAAPAEFEPNVSQDISVNWQSQAGTVYGGTVDVVSGKLVADRAIVTGTWSKSPNYNHVFYRTGMGNKTFPVLVLSDVISNILPTVQANSLSALDNMDYGIRVTDIIYAVNKDCSTAEEFNTWATQNDLQVIYTLATPQTYQLDPITVQTLLGNNTVYVDCGSVSVDYPADTGIVVAEQSNAIDAKQDATSYVTVSGTIVTQTGVDDTMYLCGELAELTFTAPATGQTAIRFTSGTTPTVAIFSGVTWLNGFDPNNIEASKTYEVNILNGVGVAAWT